MRLGRLRGDHASPLIGRYQGAPELDTAIKVYGTGSTRFKSAEGNYWELQLVPSPEDTIYLSGWVFIPEEFPTEAGAILRMVDAVGTFFEVSIGSTAQKNIRTFAGGAETPAAIGANSPEVKKSEWYFIELQIKVNPTNLGNMKVSWGVKKLNGETFHPTQTGELKQATGRNIGLKFVRAGNVSPRTMTGLHWDNVVINDSKYTVDNGMPPSNLESTLSNPPKTRCYSGASMDGETGILEGTGERADAPYGGTGTTTWDLFEKHAGRESTLVGYSHSNWGWDNFGAGASMNVINRTAKGEIPVITMTSSGTVKEVNEGKKDAVIDAWAVKAREFAYPFFMRMWWEFNGNWWANWDREHFTATEFVEAWRRIVNRIRAKGATNVTMVWCPNVITGPANAWDARPWYPGDEYVDWVGIDGYVGTQPQKNEGWMTPLYRFQYTYDRLRQIAPSKPIMINEVGASETGGNKATWIREFFAEVENNWTMIKGVLWFNDYIEHGGERITWPIESSVAATEAYEEKVTRPFFSTFGSKEMTTMLPVPEPGEVKGGRPTVCEAAELLYSQLYPHTLEDEDNDWHLLRFCNALMCGAIEPVRFLVADSDSYPGWSVILNADDMPAAQLPYLAQFVGVEFEPSLNEEEQREKIRERPAQARGRPATLLSAAQRRLIGGKSVIMFERFEGDAYKLFMRTYKSQTPEPAGTEADIFAQKPAGIKLDFAVIEGNPYAVSTVKFATYAARTAHGTYAKTPEP